MIKSLKNRFSPLATTATSESADRTFPNNNKLFIRPNIH